MGDVYRFDVKTDRSAALTAAADAISSGKCIVLPTDTVYGIGASALQPAAITRLLDAKQRGREMPPPVLIAEPAMLGALTDDVPYFASKLADQFWPGALTIIVRAQDSLDFDLGETHGTIAVRVPDNEFTRELLRHTGPLAVSSANVSGQDAALNIDDAIEMLDDTVAVYLDDGPAIGGVASTIVDFSVTSTGQILRKGALSFDELVEWASQLKDLPEPEASATAEVETDSETQPMGEPDSNSDPAAEIQGGDGVIELETALAVTDRGAEQLTPNGESSGDDAAAILPDLES